MAAPVAFFLPSLGGGGAERVTARVAGGLAESGLEVDLVTAGSGGAYRGEIHPQVRLVELGARRVLTSVPALAAYLRRRRPRALLAAMAHANIAALLARGVARVPCRVVFSERASFAPMRRYASPRLRLAAALRRHFYPRADAVIAVSEGVADDLVENAGLPRERIEVIYNPVVTPALDEKARLPVDHPWFGSKLDSGLAAGRPPVIPPPVILGVGRLKAQKNFAMLIRAFARLRGLREARWREARLLILGEGPERESLEALTAELGVAEHVDLPGFAPNPYAYMARADLFVLSSNVEGLPGALLEAMAVGCPVVATDCESGPREILRGGALAPLVPPDDEDAMVEALAGALEHPPPVEPLKARAAEFSLEAILPRYRRILDV